MKHGLFIHGTGVREPAYTLSFNKIEEELKKVLPDVELHRCFWGELHGARLQAGGLSIPNYAEEGGTALEAAITENVLWSQLYRDPLMELRSLPLRTSRASGPPLPAQTAAQSRLRKELLNFKPSLALSNILSSSGVQGLWEPAIDKIRNSIECNKVVNMIMDDDTIRRRLIARSIVAQLYQLAEESGIPSLSGSIRDQILNLFTDELSGYGLGIIPDWIKQSTVGLGTWLVNHEFKGRRGHYSDAAVPAAGDILLYQTRGDQIRGYIRDRIHAYKEGVVLIAHSLGGIASVDLLIQEEFPQVDYLITMGSQVPFFYELDILTSLRYGYPLPAHFPRWLNFYDPQDLLSYKGAELFKSRLRDVKVDNGQPFPQSHSSYWSNASVWKVISEALG